MTCRNVLLQKENDCKFQLHFVRCCTLVVTEGYHLLLSPLNRLLRCHFIMFRMYLIRTSWEHNQQKRKCVNVNGAGGSEPLRRGIRGQSPPQKTFRLVYRYKKNLFLLNSVQEFIEIEVWLLMTFFLCLHNELISIYCHIIKEYRCLKNVIHQLEINKWLLLSAFQQGLRQKLVFVLKWENTFS